jgi:futalosine hydrolase
MSTPSVLLLAVAAPNEAGTILSALGVSGAIAEWQPRRVVCGGGEVEVLLTGVGKANAAGAVARVLDPFRHRGVLSAGVAGALPTSGLLIGASVLASECVFADEGVDSPEGFVDLAARGFPPGPWAGTGAPADAALGMPWAGLVDRTGPIATVSVCSGTDARASAIAARTGALAEAMEGAAVAAIASRLGAPFGELRVISNTTGTNPSWDLPAALARLGALVHAGLARTGRATP